MALTEIEKYTLLKMARAAISSAVLGKPAEEFELSGESVKKEAGAFVTLHKAGRLRGCIGTFASPNPIYRTVADMAVAAALKDPRFPPVASDELCRLEIEISVLSPLAEIDDPSAIEIGRHGLYIVKGRKRGVLLPQVAIEHGFDRDTFLEETCVKAGLNPDEWRDGATIFVFEADIFREAPSGAAGTNTLM